MRPPYHITGETTVSDELKELCERRVRPFLNRAGIATRPVEFLMCEAYLQGLKDAADVYGAARSASEAPCADDE